MSLADRMKPTGGAAAVVAAFAALLSGCGSGSSSSMPGAISSSAPAAATPATASGVLTAFGSVFVNGVEYAINNATTVLDADADDAVSSEAALQVGMTLDVDASSGTATQLRYMSAVRGEVDAIDTSKSTLTVLGQTVVVSSGTSFAGSSGGGSTATSVTGLSSINVGDYVVVYGYIDCTGSTSGGSCASGATQILASLVYEPAMAGIYRTMGYAQNLSANGGSFTINGLTVTYATGGSSMTSCSPSPCSIAAGDFVAVRSYTAPTVTGNALTLAASRIEVVSAAPVLVSGETASIEGPVANLNITGNSFTVRGVTVDGSALASTVATLAVSEIVEVTGTVSAAGTLTASAITIEHRASLAMAGPLTAADGTADTVTLLGQTFSVNSSTKFADRARDVQPFNLSNFASVLSPSDFVAVSGYSTASGLVATRVERLPTPGTAFVAVQGVVSQDSISASTLTIGGVTVTLGASTRLMDPGAGASATIGALLADITPGTTVAYVIGSEGPVAGTITATLVALAQPDGHWASEGF